VLIWNFLSYNDHESVFLVDQVRTIFHQNSVTVTKLNRNRRGTQKVCSSIWHK